MKTTNKEVRKRPRFRDKVFNPSTDYFMVSYHRTSDCSWIRIPFLLLGEVKDVIEELPMQIRNKEEGKGLLAFDFTDLKVHSESWLSQLQSEWDEEQQKYVDAEITNRQYFYGGRYEDYAERFTGKTSLARKTDEPLERWEERIASAKESSKTERLARLKDLSDLKDQRASARKSWGLEKED